MRPCFIFSNSREKLFSFGSHKTIINLLFRIYTYIYIYIYIYIYNIICPQVEYQLRLMADKCSIVDKKYAKTEKGD